MAEPMDAPQAPGAGKSDGETPRSMTSSLLGGNERIPSIWPYLFTAAAVDGLLAWWVPGAGTAFVLACRGWYFIQGYKTDKMATTTAVNAIAGFVPIIADISNIAFVISSYSINRAETSRLGSIAVAAYKGRKNPGEGGGVGGINTGSEAGMPGERTPRTLEQNQMPNRAPRPAEEGGNESLARTAAPTTISDRNTARPRQEKRDDREAGNGPRKNGIDGVRQPGDYWKKFGRPGVSSVPSPEIRRPGIESGSGAADYANDDERAVPRNFDGIRDYRDAA